MEGFTKIINFIMEIIDLIMNFFNKHNNNIDQNPAPDAAA